MAPTPEDKKIKTNSIVFKILSLSHTANMVEDIEDLIKLRDGYVSLMNELQDKLNDSSEPTLSKKARFFKNDPVLLDLADNGGVGVDLAEKRAQKVFTLIKDSLSKTIDNLADINFSDDEKASYDSKNKILKFKQKNIVIAKNKAESYPADLLRTLFKTPSKPLAFDEILEDWYSEEEDRERATKTKRIYQAGKALNRKIAQETNCKDFLILTTKEVSINNLYT